MTTDENPRNAGELHVFECMNCGGKTETLLVTSVKCAHCGSSNGVYHLQRAARGGDDGSLALH